MEAGYRSGNAHPFMQRAFCRILLKVFLTTALLVLGSGIASAADFQLGSGDSFNLGAGTLDLQCGNFALQSGAVFNAAGGQIRLSGDWDNQGVFNRGSSGVSFNDACGAGTVSVVSGETHFHDLNVTTSMAHELRLTSWLTQTIAGSLVLAGADGQLLRIRSSIPSSPAFFLLETAGSQLISWVDVQDNVASDTGQWLALGKPEHFNSVDSGRNSRWFLIGLEPIPALSKWGLVLLVLLFAAGYLRRTGRMLRS